MDKVERLEQSVRELQVLCKKMVHTIALHVESTHDTKIQVTKKPAKVVDKYKAKPKDLDMVVDYFITKGLTKKSPILKYLFDLSVEAPQYLSPGTFIFPILSNSILYFIFDSLL